MQARVLSFGNHKTSPGIKSQSKPATIRILKNTSLAAFLPLASIYINIDGGAGPKFILKMFLCHWTVLNRFDPVRPV